MNKSFLFIVLISLMMTLTSCWGNANSNGLDVLGESTSTPTLMSKQPLNDEDYTEVLKKYLDASGRVDYGQLKRDRKKLDQFNAGIASVSPSAYNAWTDPEKIAFLLNAYNALTLEVIINHYPTKSIREISGVWDRLEFTVVGQKITLNAIEHETLRKKFNEPRIHMALVCASIGCPKLRKEPYTAEKLNTQLDQQARIFLASPSNFRIDRETGKVYVSSLFKWFGEDFQKNYGKPENIQGLNDKEAAIVNFISRYVSPDDRTYLEQGKYQINYLNYDWSLNDKQ